MTLFLSSVARVKQAWNDWRRMDKNVSFDKRLFAIVLILSRKIFRIRILDEITFQFRTLLEWKKAEC